MTSDSFDTRPPSTAWEAVSVSDAPPVWVWVWFKPQHAPSGISVSIPAETFRAAPPERLTGANILRACGIEAGRLATWSLPFPLEQPLPPPADGTDVQIHFWLHAVAETPGLPPAVSVAEPATGDVFERIDADWRACLHFERQLELLRKQSTDLLSRLNSLNRDLSPEERLHADRQDQNEWQDARRWIRDVASQLSRCVKEQVIGDATDAGQRTRFESVYEQFVVPRQPFEAMERTRVEFESYRKLVQTLLLRTQTAHSRAVQDGEQRARRVLQKISAKTRSSRTKRR